MKKLRLLALASLFVLSAGAARAWNFTETFATDPLQNGWQIFGDTSLFHWNATNQNLEVTWDSSRPNSYFYLPLSEVITKNDDFSFSFDLTLWQAGTGDSTGPLSLALGFLNTTNAMDPSFERGAGISPDIAEFDYYPHGFYPPSFDSPATATPGFVDDASGAFAPDDLTPYELELPTNVVIHASLAYTGSNQTAVLVLTTNGTPLAQFPPLVISTNGNGGFAPANDFHVNMFSITSYSEAGTFPPYVASIYAKGAIGNLAVNVPPPAQNLTVAFIGGNWQAQFSARTNWLYTLERTTDFKSWTGVSPTAPGVNGIMVLPDTNGPAGRAFYRVRANRP
jgi:hypothetical protein